MTLNSRNTWVDVDLDAIRSNAESLLEIVRIPRLCAVVKADAYGHGAVPVAQAALEGGAWCLAVATVEEAIALRDAGIQAQILLLSEPAEDVFDELVEASITPVIYSKHAIEQLRNTVRQRQKAPYPVHLKIDTGMRRVGCDATSALDFARVIHLSAELQLAGLCTHLATADEKQTNTTDAQIRQFRQLTELIKSTLHVAPIVHAANSAAALRYPESRFDMIRCGIALYGLQPAATVVLPKLFRPALSVRSSVAFVRRLHRGECLSYGQHYRLTRDANIAVVPVGYADGFPRKCFSVGTNVLIGGRRREIAGMVTMDQLMVNCGDDPIKRGDEVVLIGEQREVTISVSEVAEKLGTIDYEVVCGMSKRMPRRYFNE